MIIVTFEKNETRRVIDNASHGPATRWRMCEANHFGFQSTLAPAPGDSLSRLLDAAAPISR